MLVRDQRQVQRAYGTTALQVLLHIPELHPARGQQADKVPLQFNQFHTVDLWCLVFVGTQLVVRELAANALHNFCHSQKLN